MNYVCPKCGLTAWVMHEPKDGILKCRKCDVPMEKNGKKKEEWR